MTRRVIQLSGTVAALIAVTLLLEHAPVTGQTPAPEAAPATPTAWGDPDLQGLWTTRFDTPLQRPARFADQEFFSDEERAEIDDRRTEILERDSRPSEGSPLGLGGAYNRAVFLTHKETGRRTSLIVDPPDGRIPPLTPEATARQDEMQAYRAALLKATAVCENGLPGCAGGEYGAPSPRRFEPPPSYPATSTGGGGAFNRADGPEDRGLGERCMGARLPDFGGAAGFVLQIIQSPQSVSVFYDTGQGQAWQRLIPVTDRPHLPSHVRQWFGDSRGSWNGDSLVVDVTNFSKKTDFRGSRENLHLVERWTRLDADTLEYVATMDDPTTWTQPWTVVVELKRQDARQNRVYIEPRCHEGNYGLPALLAGARADEAAFAMGKGPDPATVCTAGCSGRTAEADRDPLR